MENTDYLNELNDAQRAAVVYNDGPALVIAGAGSGKTRVLVYKLLHLLHSGYSPSKLMALTFTRKAAREMRERISVKAPMHARHIQLGTFHSIFSRILRESAELLGYTRNFTIYNSTDSRNKIKQILKQMGLDEQTYKVNVVHSRISSAKNDLHTASSYANSRDRLERDRLANMPRICEVYAHYERELRASNAMDYDDLLLQTNLLFKHHPDVLAYWQERIDYLLIDEYQDTNFAQYMIARQLMQDKGAIFVVGDDAQSIYSFRGANIENILSFQKTFPTAKTFKLEQNYRSSQTIVRAAGSVISYNQRQIKKSVFSEGEVGEPIEIHEALTADLEALWVSESIRKQCATGACSFADFAVLYRTNAQSRILEQAFRRGGVPFRIYGGQSFFEHKEIMDVLGYFRLIVNPHDETALLRVINYPKRGIGDSTVAKLREYARLKNIGLYEALVETVSGVGLSLSKGTLSKLQQFYGLIERMSRASEETIDFAATMQQLIFDTGIVADLAQDMTEQGISRQQNVRELHASIVEYAQLNREEGQPPSISGYLNEVALMTDQDKNKDDDMPRVTAMTVHASKGLEFPHVYIIGLEDKLFPSIRYGEATDNIEEERRLFYVAITRAEKSCHIGYARERFLNGRTEFVKPSRFLNELPKELARGNTAAHINRRYPGSASTNRGSESVELPRRFVSTGSEEPSRQIIIGTRAVDAPRIYHQQVGELHIGARVRHHRFGDGEILTLEGEGDKLLATVCFDTGDTKTLLIRFAKLELLSE